ncbi:amidohydrolase family protein [Cellulomonas timonensis]|uniref:amidohydrolase family protein n=1 Tax=Cellulomonas timonensis TaxID=1689271 RepID=UPI00082C82FC|nr:amidohydrolase family protein [Cellulomonas timonensis]
MDELLLTRARIAGTSPDGARVTRPHGEPLDLHVRDGKVAAIGPGLDATVRPEVERVDLEGRVVLPGLWDAHVHLAEWALTLREHADPADAAVSLGPEALDALIAEAAQTAAARGVVGVVDFDIADNLTAWRRRIDAGHRRLRVEVAVWPGHLDRVVAEELHSGDVLVGTDGLLTMGSLKIVADGTLKSRTAYCFDPYPGLDGDNARGVLSVAPGELWLLMAHAHRKGLRCAIHAIGDAATAVALDAFEASGARGSIEHAQLVDPDDIRRFVDLGIVASVQPEHAMDDRDMADEAWAGRTDRAFAFASLAAAGVRLALGSDAPIAPLDPWAAIAAAVTRARDGREPWHPEQRLDLETALGASVRSRVEPGHVADLAVLDIDPWVAADLRDMTVAATLLGGRWTWQAW